MNKGILVNTLPCALSLSSSCRLMVSTSCLSGANRVIPMPSFSAMLSVCLEDASWRHLMS